MILKNNSISSGSEIKIQITKGCITDIFVNGKNIDEISGTRMGFDKDIIIYSNLGEIKSIEIEDIGFQEESKELSRIFGELNNETESNDNKIIQKFKFNHLSDFSLLFSIFSLIVSLLVFGFNFFDCYRRWLIWKSQNKKIED